MKRALAVFLLVASLVAFAQAADIKIAVGDPKLGNVFVPDTTAAAPGDNLVFTWGKGTHSVVESDDAKSCVKSAKVATPFATDIITGPKEMTYTIPKDAGPKLWFFCSVPKHCVPGTGGMTLTVDLSGAAPPAPGGGGAPAPGGGAPPAGGASPSMPMPGGGAMPTNGTAGAAPSTTPSAASRNYNYFAVGVLFSSMCMAASYVL